MTPEIKLLVGLVAYGGVIVAGAVWFSWPKANVASATLQGALFTLWLMPAALGAGAVGPAGCGWAGGEVVSALPDESGFPAVDLPAGASPAGAVACLLGELVRRGALPAGAAATVEGRIRRREELGSTAIGRGLALPHA